MSFTHIAAAWAHDGISSNRKLVLQYLAFLADDQGRCWPSIQTIADCCGISERSAREHVSSLVESGYLRRKTRVMRSSVYFINLEKLTPRDPKNPERYDEDDPETWGHVQGKTSQTIPAYEVGTPGKKAQFTPANPADIPCVSIKKIHTEQTTTAAPAAALMCADIGNEHREPCEPDPLGNANPADLEAFAKVRADAGKPGKPTPREAAALASEARAAGITPAQLVSYCAALRLPGFKARYFNPRHMERIEAEHARATAASRPAAPPPILAAQEGRTNEGTRTGRAMAAAMLQKLRGAPRKAESRPDSLSRQPAPSAPGIFDHVAQAFGLTAAPAW